MPTRRPPHDSGGHGPDPIGLAERVLAILDEGSFTATYKFAVLLALLDCCLEQAQADGRPPAAIGTRALARRTLELYWPQTNGFAGPAGTVMLRQNSSNQAEILSRIYQFRDRHGADRTPTAADAEHLAAADFTDLLEFAEWKLAEMPLPRLQRLGQRDDRFLYDLDWHATGWGASITQRQLRDGTVRREVRLRAGVADELLRLHGLLRPLIEREWAATVARFNRDAVGDYELDAFLFGRTRTPPGRLKADLSELQQGACFYCGRQLRTGETAEIDHFLPWARHPDEGIHNLVVADRTCNNSKRAYLASAEHVERWRCRLDERGHALTEIAGARQWPAHLDRTLGAVRAVYLHLPTEARLWLARDAFTEPDRDRLVDVLGERPVADAAAEPDAGPWGMPPEGPSR